MEEGDIVRVDLPQADDMVKVRPVLLLKQVPPFGDWLVCGISSSIGLEVKGFDLVVDENDPLFKKTGLKHSSLIRLGFLSARPKERISDRLGSIGKAMHKLLCDRLADHLRS